MTTILMSREKLALLCPKCNEESHSINTIKDIVDGNLQNNTYVNLEESLLAEQAFLHTKGWTSLTWHLDLSDFECKDLVLQDELYKHEHAAFEMKIGTHPRHGDNATSGRCREVKLAHGYASHCATKHMSYFISTCVCPDTEVTNPKTGEPLLGAYHILNLINPESALIKPVIATSEKRWYSRLHTFARSRSMNFRANQTGKRGHDPSSIQVIKKAKKNPWVHDKYEELYGPRRSPKRHERDKHQEHTRSLADSRKHASPNDTDSRKLGGCSKNPVEWSPRYHQPEHGGHKHHRREHDIRSYGSHDGDEHWHHHRGSSPEVFGGSRKLAGGSHTDWSPHQAEQGHKHHRHNRRSSPEDHGHHRQRSPGPKSSAKNHHTKRDHGNHGKNESRKHKNDRDVSHRYKI